MSLLSVMNQWRLLTLSTEAKTILGLKMSEKNYIKGCDKANHFAFYASYVLCAKFEFDVVLQ